MTLNFYPLYFMNDCGMSPAEVQAIYFCVPLAMLACGSLSTRLAASGFGRVQTIILCKGLGVASLLVFIFVQRFRDVGPYLKPLILVPPFLLATALTDATYPLEESTLMDFVPVERRGRWKSLESVSNFGWCGSAVLGGYLVDRFDYSFTFFITALIQGGAVLIWLALVPLVPKSEAPLARGVKRDPADSNGLNRAHSKGYYTDNRTRTLSGFRSQSVEFRLPSTSR
jgi:MFS family permease